MSMNEMGTHNILSVYTHNILGTYTHEFLQNLKFEEKYLDLQGLIEFKEQIVNLIKNYYSSNPYKQIFDADIISSTNISFSNINEARMISLELNSIEIDGTIFNGIGKVYCPFSNDIDVVISFIGYDEGQNKMITSNIRIVFNFKSESNELQYKSGIVEGAILQKSATYVDSIVNNENLTGFTGHITLYG